MAGLGTLPSDAASKKFWGACSDAGGSNELNAVAGVNRRTQNGETVVDYSAHVTTSSGAGQTIGSTSDAAVPTGAGTLSGKLRAIAEALGATSGAAVITDAAGTIQQYARGLVVLMLSLIAKFPASIGQKAKAASLAVTLASDEDLLSRLPATIGQKAKAASLAVALASDDDLLARLPASLGTKAAAASFAVTPASDGIFNISQRSGVVYGNSSSVAGIGDLTVSADLSSIGSTPTVDTFNGAHASFTADPKFFWVPMDTYAEMAFSLNNTLDQNIAVTLIATSYNAALGWAYTSGIDPTTPAYILAAQTINAGATGLFVPDAGGTGAGANIFAVPALRSHMGRYLIIKVDPAGDPTSGALWLAVTRVGYV